MWGDPHPPPSQARTPLIISGPTDESPQLYIKVNRLVPKLVRQEKEDSAGDFWVDEKQRQVHLSEAGMEHAEALLRTDGIIGEDETLYDSKHLAVVHHLNAALRAHSIYQKDVDYIVRDGEVIIVDEFTGRLMTGRRWAQGVMTNARSIPSRRAGRCFRGRVIPSVCIRPWNR